jgi:ureidoglycolate hydrolase
VRRRVHAETLSDEAWRPFGWIPKRDSDPLDGRETLQFSWGDPHANVICHHSDEISHTEDGLVCEMFFRHLSHTQVLLVLDGRAVIAVAPASCDLSGDGDLDAIRAFLLHRHDSVVLHPGTWHWGPFPLDGPRVELFNIQGRRYAEDNDCARLAAMGAEVEVIPPPGVPG